MSDHLIDLQYDLPLEDVGLPRGEFGGLPVLDLTSDVEGQILQARRQLGSGSK
jgi:hypothetical protein